MGRKPTFPTPILPPHKVQQPAKRKSKSLKKQDADTTGRDNEADDLDFINLHYPVGNGPSKSRKRSELSPVKIKRNNEGLVCAVHARRGEKHTFPSPGQAVQHMHSHLGIKPYLCQFCGKGSTAKSANATHEGTCKKRPREEDKDESAEVADVEPEDAYEDDQPPEKKRAVQADAGTASSSTDKGKKAKKAKVKAVKAGAMGKLQPPAPSSRAAEQEGKLRGPVPSKEKSTLGFKMGTLDGFLLCGTTSASASSSSSRFTSSSSAATASSSAATASSSASKSSTSKSSTSKPSSTKSATLINWPSSAKPPAVANSTTSAKSSSTKSSSTKSSSSKSSSLATKSTSSGAGATKKEKGKKRGGGVE
ncbi:hypothetical protein JCM8097_005394 [Rhodosporidiobolus ruineniae]